MNHAGLPAEVLKTPEVQELVRIARLAVALMAANEDRFIRKAGMQNQTAIESILMGAPFKEGK